MSNLTQRQNIEVGGLWRRLETGRVYKVQVAHKNRVLVRGITGLWSGRPEKFIKLFEEVVS